MSAMRASYWCAPTGQASGECERYTQRIRMMSCAVLSLPGFQQAPSGSV